jgi:hypothetical protein
VTEATKNAQIIAMAEEAKPPPSMEASYAVPASKAEPKAEPEVEESKPEETQSEAQEAEPIPEPPEVELERLKRESAAMVRYLKSLEEKEVQLVAQNDILAREALICGFDPGILGPPTPRRRQSKKKVAGEGP